MKRNPKSPKASTASSADNITLDVPTPLLQVKQMERNGSKQHKNGNNGSIDEIDSYELLEIIIRSKRRKL
jgi:hypothetical protein